MAEESCCHRTKKFCSSSFLIIANLVDLLAGCAILIYAIWLQQHHYAPLWLWGCCAGLAALLMFTALVSWGGVNSQHCPGLLTCSLEVPSTFQKTKGNCGHEERLGWPAKGGREQKAGA